MVGLQGICYFTDFLMEIICFLCATTSANISIHLAADAMTISYDYDYDNYKLYTIGMVMHKDRGRLDQVRRTSHKTKLSVLFWYGRPE